MCNAVRPSDELGVIMLVQGSICMLLLLSYGID